MNYYNFDSEPEKFPLYHTFTIPQNAFSELKTHFNLTNKNTKFEESQIFNTKSKQNEINNNIRLSEKYSIKDKQSFELVNNKLIPFLNDICDKDKIILQLVEDDIEIIKYNKDGFFAPHTDFVNFISDQMKCYTVLVCLEGCEEGGETKLHFSDVNTKTVSGTKTTGQGLLFRYEIIHEGQKVINGTKIVLKLNIHAFKKYDNTNNITNDYLTVRFYDDTRIYVLHKSMYEKYSKSIFAGNSSFNSNNNEIILQNITYEQFEPAYQLLNNNNNNYNIDYINNQELFDYLGLDNSKTTLLNRYNQNLITKMENKLQKLNNFLSKQEKLWLVKNYDDYKAYKNILSPEDNIIPIQFMLTNQDKEQNVKLEFISIYDAIPVMVDIVDYDTENNTCWLDLNKYKDKNNISIELIRLHMIKSYMGYYSDKNNTDYTRFIQINRKLIESTNEYEFLREFMELFFMITFTYHSEVLFEQSNHLSNNDISKTQHVEVNKLINSINAINTSNIIEELIAIKKNSSLKDYVVNAYNCNQASYFLYHANIYFGFLHI